MYASSFMKVKPMINARLIQIFTNHFNTDKMKNLKFYSAFLILFGMTLVSMQLHAQNSDEPSGFEGDNFSLEAALEMFKSSTGLDDFERKLNEEDNKVNNLDLNEDGQTDYIRIIDNAEGEAHAIVLQAVLGEDDFQDIAVIEIERSREDYAILQILGDEDVFGEQTIVEPYEESESGEGNGPDGFDDYAFRVVVNVYTWPTVRFIYGPAYVPYVSPWSWLYYPTWWRPWRPLAWTVWHPFRYRYHSHYQVVNVHRVSKAHVVYTPKRRTNTVVVNKTKVQRTKVSTSRSTTVVAGKNSDGNRGAAVKTEKSVKVEGAGGKSIEKSKSNTKAAAKTDKGKVKAEKNSKSTKVKGDKSAAAKKTSKTKVKKKKNN